MEDVQEIGYGSFLRCQAALLVFFIRFDLFSSVSLVCSCLCRNICLGGGGCGSFLLPFEELRWEATSVKYLSQETISL